MIKLETNCENLTEIVNKLNKSDDIYENKLLEIENKYLDKINKLENILAKFEKIITKAKQ